MYAHKRGLFVSLGLSIGLIVLTLGLLEVMSQVGLARPLSTDVSGTIDTDTTWYYTGTPYVLTTDIVVTNGVTLTIEPGVMVRGEGSVQLEIRGHLQAVGLVTRPITFTSVADNAPHTWAGLLFKGGTGELSHAIVRYGGDVLDGVPGDLRSNIAVLDVLTGEVRIENSSVLSASRSSSNDYGLYIGNSYVLVSDTLFAGNGNTGESGDYGLYTDPSSAVTITVTGCRFENNNNRPVGVRADSVHRVTGSTFSGNEYDRVWITGGSVVTGATLAPQTGLEGYELGGSSVAVPAGVTLTVEPGVTVMGGNSKNLNVLGHLSAVGLVTQPITFTSWLDSGAGEWDGLLFDGGTGHLRYAVVRYGGQSDKYQDTNITVYGVLTGEVHIENSWVLTSNGNYGLHAQDSRVVVSGTLFANNGNSSGDYGLYADATSIVTVTGCIFENNNGYAVGVWADSVQRVTGNTFSGNGYDRVRVAGGSVVTGATLVPQTGLEGYELGVTSSVEVPDGVTLTVEPGVKVMGGNSKNLNVLGHLSAVGLVTQPITFTSWLDSGAGEWDGLLFDGGTGHLRYAVVRYGGNKDGANQYTNITVQNVLTGEVRIEHSWVLTSNGNYGLHAENSRVVVSGTLFANNGVSDDYGLYVADANSVVTVTGCTFANNNGYAVRVLADGVQRVTGNSFGGNTYDRVRIASGSVVTGTILMRQTGLEGYELESSMTVPGSVTLTVEPGVAVMGGNDKQLTVQGHLSALGTETQPITFTSATNTGANQWDGLVFDGGTGHLCYATVRYGGQGDSVGVNTNITVRDVLSGEVRIENSWVLTTDGDYGLYVLNSYVVVSNTAFADNGVSDDYGLYVADANSVVTVTGCTFANNNGYAVRVLADGVQRVTGNSFSGNTYDRVLIASGSVVTNTTLVSQTGLEGYELGSSMTVPDGVTLTVEPGVMVMGGDDQSLVVQGHLFAVGLETQSITFTSAADAGSGEWDGLLFDGGTGHLRYVTVRYGGDSDGVKFTNITVRDVLTGEVRIEDSWVLTSNSSDGGLYVNDSLVAVSDTLFANNGSYGLYVDTGGVVTVTGSTFENNGYAVRVLADGVQRVTGNSFGGNTYDRVLIAGGLVVTGTTLTRQTGLEGYELGVSLTVPDSVTLTVEPGVTVMGGNDKQLTVQGHLSALGTEAQPITFTSATNSGPEGWDGLVFNGGTGHLRYATVRYGGQGDSVGVNTNITVWNVLTGEVRIENSWVLSTTGHGLYASDSYVVVSDTVFYDNGDSSTADYGLYATGGSVITVTGSTIRDNVGTGVKVESSHADLTCVTVANNQDGIHLTSGGTLFLFSSAIGDNVDYGLNNGTGVTVTVPYNWWGSPTGPKPGGSGDTVSDYVDFDPWLRKAMCASMDDADLAVTGSVSPVLALVGDLFTYTLTITNYGPSSATSVTLTDMLPLSVTLDAAIPSQGTSCNESGGVVTCALGTLGFNETATVTITVIVDPLARGGITNAVEVASAETDPDTYDNEDIEETGVYAEADLAVIKTGSSGGVAAGQPLTYTVTVTNIGPAAAIGAILTDTLPVSVTLDKVTTNQGVCTGTNTITCTLDTLNPNVTATVTIAVAVDPLAWGTITNTVRVAGDETDLIMGNNVYTKETMISAEADLAVAKLGSSDVVTAGHSLTYTVAITNNGPSAATGVTLTDTLPLSVTLDKVTTNQGVCTGTNTITCTLDTLNPNVTATVTIAVAVDPLAWGTITNTVRVAGDETDLIMGNNVYTKETMISAEADLAVAKLGSSDVVTAGHSLTYTVAITNNGPSAATGVILTDTLSLSVIFGLAIPSQGTGCGESGNVVTCTLGALDRAGIVTVTIIVTPTVEATITNMVSVRGIEYDPIVMNNTDTETTTVETGEQKVYLPLVLRLYVTP